MLLYNLFYLSLPLLYVICQLLKKGRKYFLFIIGCLMILLLTFRGITVGSDTITYYNIFNWTSSINLFEAQQSNIEYGYLLLNRFIHFVNGNFTLLLFVISLITIFGILQFIYNFSDNIFMSIIVFVGFTYYFMAFNISRQFLAIGIDLIASTYLIRGKKWKSLLLIIIAGLMHNAGYLYLILWILIDIKVTKKVFTIFLAFITAISLPATKFIGQYMINNQRYNAIVNSSNAGKGMFGILFSLSLLMLLIFMIINFNFNNSNLLDRYVLYSFTLIVVLNLLVIFFPYLGRIRYSFEVLIVVCIPYLVKEYSLERFIPVINIGLLPFGLLFMNILIPNNVFYGIIPYVFV